MGKWCSVFPTSEMSHATNARNVDTISIECCHPDETGQFNDATYSSAVKLTACSVKSVLGIGYGSGDSALSMLQEKTVPNIMWKTRMYGSG